MPLSLPEPIAELVREEIDSPGSLENVLERVETCYPDLTPLWRFLSLKDHQHRHAFYVKAEHVFFRRLGWRLMKPFFGVSLLAAVVLGFVFSRQKIVDPSLATALFLGGAAAFYVALQVFLHRWAWRDVKKLSTVEEEYKKKLGELLEAKE